MSSKNGHHPDSEANQSPVEDIDNLSHTEKQQLLEHTRKQVLQARSDARTQMAAGRLSRQQACEYYRGVIETLLIQLNPILERQETEKDYLEGVEIGRLTFSPPEDLVDYAKDNLIRLAGPSTVPQPKQVEVAGLKSIVELPSPIQMDWVVVVEMGSNIERKEAAKQQEIPFAMLDESMQMVDRAMDEIGLGYEIDEQPEAGGEYTDIVDE